MEKLGFVDRLFHTYKKAPSSFGQECPKTMLDNDTLRDHKKMVVHQVARWLETIYEPDELGIHKLSDDQSLQNKLHTLKTIFDYLRGGRLQELQKFLMNHITFNELYLHQFGNIPFFDNICYEQQ